jgi:hypothetical protein
VLGRKVKIRRVPGGVCESYTQVMDQSASGWQTVVRIKPMPGLTMQYGWHICNQDIVPQVSCVEGVSGEYCGSRATLLKTGGSNSNYRWRSANCPVSVSLFSESLVSYFYFRMEIVYSYRFEYNMTRIFESRIHQNH